MKSEDGKVLVKYCLDFQDINECHSIQAASGNDDSFVTSLTNVDVSLPSNSSGSYVTAFCESVGSNEMFNSMSPAASGPEDVDGKSRRQGSFDADSGKGGSPLPPQHIDVDISDLEIHDETVTSTLLSQVSRKGSLELLNKGTRNIRTILDELQSEAVSDDVKAKNLASLNRVILQCKDYMQRYSVRQDLMSLGLFNALPSLIESRNRGVESELEIFFAGESNDNLVGSGTRHPIDIFQKAYVKVKHSTSAEILLDILELIAKIQPSGKRLWGVLHYLQRGHMRNAGVQTEMVTENDSCDTAPSQNVARGTNVQDHLVLNKFSPIPQTIRRPRSTSRMKRRSGNRQIEMANIPFIDDDTATVPSSTKLDERNEEKNHSLKESPKSLQYLLPTKKQSTEKPAIASIPPPPPLPPPAPEFLNTSLVRQKPVTGSPVVVKSVSIYKKKCATNTVAWETVKPEMIVTRSTIWSDQGGIYAEFNEQERERLEKVFERTHPCSSRITATEERTRNISVDHKKEAAAIGGITEKRALNLGIVLARFRPLTLEQLVRKMESLAINDLPLDYLASLLNHFPSPEELTYFAKVKTADNLKDAELFCFLVARKPLLKLHIELKVLADNIVNDLARQLDCTRLLLTATSELHNSTSINVFFHRCLQYGNFLNQSTFAAGASGFALSSLLPALNTKGNGVTANTRLVDVLAEYADESLRAVVKVLDFLEPARKYSIDDLEKSEASLRRSLEISLKSLQECGDRELYGHYSPIIMDSTAKCGQLARSIKKVRNNENCLKEYYCASQFSLENILEILSQALRLFQDSLNKAETRAARAQRMQQQRIDAGHDTVAVRGNRCRRNGRIRTFELPNVKNLIDIINSNECR
uniref:FH2 domain-containing protein n=1 Tax=Loa loa TaxID=7209 RepID=A0A1I7VXP3_LOALO